jgi:hypothetical protein
MKYKDLKLDYKKVLETLEKSETMRRHQKEILNDQKCKLHRIETKMRQKDILVRQLESE